MTTPIAAPDPIADGWPPAPRPPVGLYVHVPFCVSLCPYCDFVVLTGRATRGPDNRVAAYLAALHAELELRADDLDARFGASRPPIGTVYLGGGTPSLLGAPAIGELLAHVGRRFGIAADAEITLEANPGPDELGDIAGFRAAGIDRLSIGAQSLDPTELQRLGRRHGPGDVADAVERARAASIRSVSLDLLTDVPGQTAVSWRRTLTDALGLGPDHLSVYALTLEDPDADGLTGPAGDHLPVRAGARRWRAEARAAQDEDRAADLDAITDELTAPAGFERYEISNLARPGHASRHNEGYWQRRSIAAVGPGAHAFDGGAERRWNAARFDAWLSALVPRDGGSPRLPPGGREVLTAADARAEALILALRTSRGIDAAWASADSAISTGLAWAIESGLMEPETDRLRLTARGRLLSSEVFLRLLPETS